MKKLLKTMNNDDIIRIAIEAGDDWEHTLQEDKEFLFRFAALVAAAEREACIALAEPSTSNQSA